MLIITVLCGVGLVFIFDALPRLIGWTVQTIFNIFSKRR